LEAEALEPAGAEAAELADAVDALGVADPADAVVPLVAMELVEPAAEIPSTADAGFDPDAFVATAGELPAADAGPEAFDAAPAVSPDAGLPGFAALDLAVVAWPDVAPVAGGIPNPAGDLTESVVDLPATAVACADTAAAAAATAA
jgi:hypothetical protein